MKAHKTKRSPGCEHQLNGVAEVGQTFLFGLTLSVRAGHFQAGRPKAALVRFAAMHDVGQRHINTDAGLVRTILVVVLPTKNSRIWVWP